jgi:anti-sigma regulatory factor (Ser/Thr protein kinase)
MASGGQDAYACRPSRRQNAPPLAAGLLDRDGHRGLTVAFGPGDLVTLRARVTAYAAEFAGGDCLDDIVLVAHELATNVIRHAGGHGRLRLWWSGTQIVCRVSDTGPGLPQPVPSMAEPPSALLPGGRGLWIARRLANLHIDTGPAGTTVTAQLPCRPWKV